MCVCVCRETGMETLTWTRLEFRYSAHTPSGCTSADTHWRGEERKQLPHEMSMECQNVRERV